MAVSYTHLDVYKRQMPVRVPDPRGTKAFVGMLVVFLVGMLVRMLDGGVLVFMICLLYTSRCV